MNISHYILGVCLNSVPGDPEMSIFLCQKAGEAQNRGIVPADPLPVVKDFDVLVSKVCWPKHKCK